MPSVVDPSKEGSSPARRRVHAGVAIVVSVLLLSWGLLLLFGASLLYYDEEGGVNYTGRTAALVWTWPLLVIVLASLSMVCAVRASRGRYRLFRWTLAASATIVAGLAYLPLIPPS